MLCTGFPHKVIVGCQINCIHNILTIKHWRNSCCRSDKSGVRPRLPPMKQKSNYKKTWEDEFLENYKPPALLSNKYVWVASIVVGAGLAVYSATLRWQDILQTEPWWCLAALAAHKCGRLAVVTDYCCKLHCSLNKNTDVLILCTLYHHDNFDVCCVCRIDLLDLWLSSLTGCLIQLSEDLSFEGPEQCIIWTYAMLRSVDTTKMVKFSLTLIFWCNMESAVHLWGA